MNIVGLITEYNPFHKGHKYHIEKAKELTGADICIVIMSGNYVQRGTPAFIDKHSRTKIALSQGADIVFELPVPFSCASAEYFATAAVTLLHKLGVVTHICFGAECEDSSSLENVADILADAKKNSAHPLNLHIKNLLKSGCSYATARSNALNLIAGNDYTNILNMPNNILAIEYLKALKTLNSPIKPIAITRVMASYHDSEHNDALYSASSVRASLTSENKCANENIFNELCSFSSIYKDVLNISAPITENDFSYILCEKLLSLYLTDFGKEKLTDYAGIDKDLASRMVSRDVINSFVSYSDLAVKLKTKNIAYTAVSRALLALILGIKKDDFNLFLENDIVAYIRLLGFRKSSSYILNDIKKKGKLTIIGQLSEVLDNNSLSQTDMQMFKLNLYCDELYNMVIRTKYKTDFPNEHIRRLTIV